MKHEAIQPPPALVPYILIEMRSDGRWHATAVIAADGDPINVVGPSTSCGHAPAAALDSLLGRHFGRAIDDDLPASPIAIDRTPHISEAIE